MLIISTFLIRLETRNSLFKLTRLSSPSIVLIRLNDRSSTLSRVRWFTFSMTLILLSYNSSSSNCALFCNPSIFLIRFFLNPSRYKQINHFLNITLKLTHCSKFSILGILYTIEYSTSSMSA